MKTLSQRLDEYLTLRRSMGFDLSFEERVLRKFTTYAGENGFDRISTPLFLDWKANYGDADDNTWSRRLGMVRRFAFWLAEHDDRTEIPSSQLVIGRYRRRVPYIYAPRQIADIVAEAGRLPSPYGLRAALWQTLFGLIAVTGMRVNEALSLDQHDVDLERAILTLRNTKNGKDRQLPVNEDTAHWLVRYAELRDRLVPQQSSRFFIKEDGEPAEIAGHATTSRRSQDIGLRVTTEPSTRHGRGPRIHDLRHTFAVHTIMDWYPGRTGHRGARCTSSAPISAIPSPSHTFWYIEAVPELMQFAVGAGRTAGPGRAQSRSKPIHCPSTCSGSSPSGCRPSCRPARTRSPAIATPSGCLLKYRARRRQGRRRTTGGHIDADIIGRFLTFCEEERGNSARSRNTRLAAIRSFFKYVAGCEPQLLHHCQKVLAMPSKRHEKRVVDFLTRDEIEALLKAPDQTTWFGRRDRVLLLTMLKPACVYRR